MSSTPSNMQTDDRHPVELLAEEFSQRMRDGESPSIDEYASRLPEHADLIRQVLASIQAMERAGNDELSKRQYESQTHRLAIQHPQLGDFRIVRRVGRGGMGVVYEAIQTSLNRRVALKVLAPGIADSPDDFRRFQLEATAVARLHHTNIVPIYGVGEADGMHFYAMQFIDGLTLADAIVRLSSLKRLRVGGSPDTTRHSLSSSSQAQATPAFHNNATTALLTEPQSQSLDQRTRNQQSLAHESLNDEVRSPGNANANPDAESPQVQQAAPSMSDFVWEECPLYRTLDDPPQYVRVVAELGRALADALAHAHQQGIIHRDIKPGNLLIDQQGIWLTDFGVAKLSTESTLTRTGMLLGTLRYMAPEQFAGQADERSDVYSLGLTLLELLTLKLVFENLTQAHLVQAKAGAEATSASQLRKECPRDLATIVLKACATEPAARYATAAELADDLQRFLDDRSILARRASPIERLVRWSRRQPLVASLTASVALSLSLLVGLFAYGNYRLNHAFLELKEAKQIVDVNVQAKSDALSAAEQQRKLAAGNLTLAIEAFEEIMQNVGSRGGAESLSIELEDGAVAYGTGVVSEADAEVLRTLLRFFERLSTENATDLSAETAAANRRTGDVLSRLGRPEDAEAAYQQALNHYRRLVAANDLEPATRDRIDVERLRLFNSLAHTATLRGDVDGALDHYRALSELYASSTALQQQDDARFEYARGLNARNSIIVRLGLGSPRNVLAARSPVREGMYQRSARRAVAGLTNLMRQIHRDSKANNQTAIGLLSGLSQAHPKRVDYALELAHAYREQARLARNELDQASATEAFRNALQLLEQLLDQHPESAYLRFVYADAVTTLAPAQVRRAGVPVARAMQITNSLVKEYPQVPDYVALKAKTLLMRNDAFALKQATELMSGLIDDYPAMLHYRLLLATALQRSATAKNEAGEADEARRLLQQAIDVLRESAPEEELPWMLTVNIERLEQQQSELDQSAAK